MEAARVNSDCAFFTKKPFGMLMAGQMIFALFTMILPQFASFRYEGFGFMQSCAFCLFVFSLFINFLHLMGWNRKVVSLSAGVNMFIPSTLLLFGMSIIFFFLFAFGSLMSVIAVFDSFRFTWRMIVFYMMTMISIVCETLCCFYLSVLLFRAAPNSQILGLVTVIIEGDKTSRMDGAVAKFSPASPTSGNPPTVV